MDSGEGNSPQGIHGLVRLSWVRIGNEKVALVIDSTRFILEVPGRGRRGRPQTRWTDRTAADMKEKRQHDDMTGDRNHLETTHQKQRPMYINGILMLTKEKYRFYFSGHDPA